MNLSLFISRRYLVSKKSHNAINIITAIAVTGIVIGATALVIVLSAFNGISGLVFGLYNTFDPDIKITPKEGKTFLPDSLKMDKIRKLGSVAHYAEILQENALLKYDDKQVIATIKGVDDQFVRMTRMDTVTREGEFLLQEGGQSFAVIGYGIAHKLTLALNDFVHPLEIYIPKRNVNSALNPDDAFNIRQLEVAGIFSLNDDFDYRFCIIPLSLARELLDRKTELSAIEIGLKKGEDAQSVKSEILSILGPGFEIKTRYEQNEVLFKTINSEKWWTFLILVFILVIATFNVVGSMTMLILEKKEDMKILSRLGADRSLIRNIFLAEGFLITMAGAALGLLLGLFVCWLQIQFKLVPFSEGFIVDAYPVTVQPLDILLVFAVVMIIGTLASWYPVRIFTKKMGGSY